MISHPIIISFHVTIRPMKKNRLGEIWGLTASKNGPIEGPFMVVRSDFDGKRNRHWVESLETGKRKFWKETISWENSWHHRRIV